MDDAILDALTDLSRLTPVLLVLVIGLEAYAMYGTMVITRMLHELTRNTRRPDPPSGR